MLYQTQTNSYVQFTAHFYRIHWNYRWDLRCIRCILFRNFVFLCGRFLEQHKLLLATGFDRENNGFQERGFGFGQIQGVSLSSLFKSTGRLNPAVEKITQTVDLTRWST